MAAITIDTASLLNSGLEATAVIAGATVVCDFRNAWANEFVDGQQINTRGPVIIIKESDLGTATIGSTITVNTVSYTILDVQPDGYGFTKLILE